MTFDQTLNIASIIVGFAACGLAARYRPSGKLDLLKCAIPSAGLAATFAFYRGHHIAWLGPSLIVRHPSPAFTPSLQAFRFAPEQLWIILDLALSAVQLFTCLILIGMMLRRGSTSCRPCTASPR